MCQARMSFFWCARVPPAHISPPDNGLAAKRIPLVPFFFFFFPKTPETRRCNMEWHVWVELRDRVSEAGNVFNVTPTHLHQKQTSRRQHLFRQAHRVTHTTSYTHTHTHTHTVSHTHRNTHIRKKEHFCWGVNSTSSHVLVFWYQIFIKNRHGGNSHS